MLHKAICNWLRLVKSGKIMIDKWCFYTAKCTFKVLKNKAITNVDLNVENMIRLKQYFQSIS